MAENCGLCVRVGDLLWIDVRCPIARRIVWEDNPYSQQDAAVILAQVGAGPCSAFILDERKQERKRKALAKYSGQAGRAAQQESG